MLTFLSMMILGVYSGFSGDTLVQMSYDEYKPISKVMVGDSIMTLEPLSGSLSQNYVLEIIKTEEPLVELEFNKYFKIGVSLQQLFPTGDYKINAACSKGLNVTTLSGPVTVTSIRPLTQTTKNVYQLVINNTDLFYIRTDGFSTPVSSIASTVDKKISEFGQAFHPLTAVLTEKGCRNIGDLTMGDRILAINPITNQQTIETITEVSITSELAMIDLMIDNQELRITFNADFFHYQGLCHNMMSSWCLMDDSLPPSQIMLVRRIYSEHYGCYFLGSPSIMVKLKLNSGAIGAIGYFVGSSCSAKTFLLASGQ
jgi:hypothetical protein